MIIFILVSIIICLFILICVLLYWVEFYRNQFYAQNDMFLYYKNKVSMLEYHFRNFKEGRNPYSVLRDMGHVLQDYCLGKGKTDGK